MAKAHIGRVALILVGLFVAGATGLAYTGYHRDGGYAQFATVHEDFVHEIPPQFDDVAASPLLCAGITTYSPMRRIPSASTGIAFV